MTEKFTVEDLNKLEQNVLYRGFHEINIPYRRIVNVVKTDDYSIEPQDLEEAIIKSLEDTVDAEEGLSIFRFEDLGIIIFVLAEDINKMDVTSLSLPPKMDTIIVHELLKLKDKDKENEEC